MSSLSLRTSSYARGQPEPQTSDSPSAILGSETCAMTEFGAEARVKPGAEEDGDKS